MLFLCPSTTPSPNFLFLRCCYHALKIYALSNARCAGRPSPQPPPQWGLSRGRPCGCRRRTGGQWDLQPPRIPSVDAPCPHASLLVGNANWVCASSWVLPTPRWVLPSRCGRCPLLWWRPRSIPTCRHVPCRRFPPPGSWIYQRSLASAPPWFFSRVWSVPRIQSTWALHVPSPAPRWWWWGRRIHV